MIVMMIIITIAMTTITAILIMVRDASIPQKSYTRSILSDSFRLRMSYKRKRGRERRTERERERERGGRNR